MRSRSSGLAGLLVVVAGSLCCGLAFAQAPVSGGAPGEASTAETAAGPAPAAAAAGSLAPSTIVPELESRRAAIEAEAGLQEAARMQAVQSYGQAIATYQELARITAAREELAARVAGAPERIRALKAEPPMAPASVPSPSAETTTDALQRDLRDAEAVLEAAKRTLSEHESTLGALQKAVASLGVDVAERRTRLEKLRSELAAPATADVPPRVHEARIAALSARKALREAEIDLYQQQLGNQDLLTELARLEREAAIAAVAHAQTTVDAIRTLLQRRRQAEAEDARARAEAAKESTARLPAPIAALAAENVALTTELEEVTKKGATTAEALKAIEVRSSKISSDFAATRQRVEVVGSTAAVGRMLRRRHLDLPSLHEFRRAAEGRRNAINVAMDRQIDLDEQLRGMSDLEVRADAVLGSLDPAAPTHGPVTREQILKLLTAQHDTVAALQKAYGRLVTELTALDVAERQLVLAADGFLDFIDERLLWIQSIPQVSLADAGLAPVAARWLVSPSSWSQALAGIAYAVRDRPLRALLGFGAVLVVFRLRRASRARLRELSNETRRIRTDRFSLTFQALLYTTAAAGALPLLLAVVAWVLAASPAATAFTLSVSAGLTAAATFLFTLDAIRRMCAPEGLGDRHFRWPAEVRGQVRSALRRFIVLGTPLVFVVAVTAEFAEPAYLEGLGRPALVAFMLAMALFFHGLSAKSGALVGQFDGRDAPNRLAEFRFLWLPALLAVPLVIAVMSAAGYHHSALALEDQIRETAWLAVALIVAREIVLRSLYIAERRLRFESALKRREEARAQREREEPDALAAGTGELAAVEEQDINYYDLGDQARRLVNVTLLVAAAGGLWAIWNELIPALGILEGLTLPMTTRELVDGVERQVPVTLADLGGALLVLAGTIVAAKNLPGLLEIAILQRLPLDPGGRYAIVTLVQYAIVAVGVIAAFNNVGAEWSSIQWLVAALSVGLGFGLQEIVANFISGIILLLERPIRVGDIVTVGDTSGTVSRIQIRATTILNYDKQELLVPNKEFITGRVLNWTLSDQLNRIFINVGVAYGSDVDKALALLAEVAAEHPQVLADPAPIVTFERFGDSALQLSLRCYLSTLEFRLATMTELHSAINRKFNDSGIVIAFPQRDLHVDMLKPIEVRMSV